MRAAEIVFVLGAASASLAALPSRAAAQPVPGPCHDGVLPGGALSRICVPQTEWNGDLLVYAHGYIQADEPIAFYHLELPDGTSLPDLVQRLGYAFATTSYRQNGLAIVEGVEDLVQLAAAFEQTNGQRPRRTFLAGVSEGGIVTALAAERAPQLFAGALSTCGPIGSFRGQINYVGDFRALFDVYYPGLIPGTATDIPPVVMQHWNDFFVPVITAFVAADPARALELINVARAPIDIGDPSTIARTIVDVLRYNVFGTADAGAKLGGNPYDNRDRWYVGSGDDVLLNLIVRRYGADEAALTALMSYESSGVLTVPMVTLHTTGDPIIPFGHEIIYQFKTQSPSGSRGRFIPIPIFRYGHCQFTVDEVLTALLVLVAQP